MDKQIKRKIIVAIIILIFGTIASIYFSVYLDTLFSKGEIDISNFKTENMIELLSSNTKTLKLFICLEMLVILSSIFYVVKNDRFVESRLIKVTPEIKIPVEAGQKQFGSARFMNSSEIDELGTLYIRRDNEKIKKLINHGYDDVKSLMRR